MVATLGRRSTRRRLTQIRPGSTLCASNGRGPPAACGGRIEISLFYRLSPAASAPIGFPENAIVEAAPRGLARCRRGRRKEFTLPASRAPQPSGAPGESRRTSSVRELTLPPPPSIEGPSTRSAPHSPTSSEASAEAPASGAGTAARIAVSAGARTVIGVFSQAALLRARTKNVVGLHDYFCFC